MFLDEAANQPGNEEDDQECDDDDEDEEEDIIILHIDIREPIKRLKKLLEQKIAVNLAKYEFWLQDAQIVWMRKPFAFMAERPKNFQFFLS